MAREADPESGAVDSSCSSSSAHVPRSVSLLWSVVVCLFACLLAWLFAVCVFFLLACACLLACLLISFFFLLVSRFFFMF